MKMDIIPFCKLSGRGFFPFCSIKWFSSFLCCDFATLIISIKFEIDLSWLSLCVGPVFSPTPDSWDELYIQRSTLELIYWFFQNRMTHTKYKKSHALPTRLVPERSVLSSRSATDLFSPLKEQKKF